MNHKLFGKFLSVGILFLTLTVAVFGCSESIPGDPEKTVEEYVKAVQAKDFEKIYSLNFLTARQKIYLSSGEGGGDEGELKEHYQESKKRYEDFRQQDERGHQWAEKYYFTPNASIEVDKARFPPGVKDDPVNAEYEKDQIVYVAVRALYRDKSEAPTLYGEKVVEAEYDCILKKIRKPGTVRVYSHDEHWYIGACIMDFEKAKVE